jgi:hypothetical protein
VLVDTGPIVAVLSERDAHHEVCLAGLDKLPGPLYTCWPVLTEAAWLLRSDPRVVRRLLEAVRDGLFRVFELSSEDAGAIAAVVKKYSNLDLQLADAALLHLARREGIDTLFTLDRRDFSIVRGRGGRRLRLIP